MGNMDWEKHFHKLADLKLKLRDDSADEYKKRVTEVQRVNELYAPKIDRVCRGFAKAVSWDFRGSVKKKILSDSSNEFIVYMDRDTITISGRSYSAHKDWNKSLTKPLDEFVEEKLAQVFEDLYKECCS